MSKLNKIIINLSLLASTLLTCGSLACGSNGQDNGNTGGSGFVVHNTGGSDAGANGGSNNGGGTSCAQQNVPLKTLPPDILIVQDRSGSMNNDISDKGCTGGCGTNSKWAQVSLAISNVVGATQTSVNWGLIYFNNGRSACGVSTVPDVAVSTTSAAQIQTSLAAATPGGSTPTTATINNAVAYMKTLTDANPKYLLLATDGEPNCLNGTANATDDQGAITAVGNSYTAGFPTFVVGIGNVATATTTLNSMATVGGYPQTGSATQYYAVTDTASLETALSKIVGLVASCNISLSNTPAGQWTIGIFATYNGTTIEIPSSTSNGWMYSDASKTSITLVGAACDNLKTGNYKNLQFLYTCVGSIIIPPPPQ
jgi:hypothetical protein